MFEGIIIALFVMAAMNLPLRGKTFESLSYSQKQRVTKAFNRYKKTKKGANDLNATVETHLVTLQKQGLPCLIAAICLLPLYVLVIAFLYM